MTRSVFTVPRMDCPSEERLVRMALDGQATVDDLRFDLAARTVTVMHRGDASPILEKLEPLGLGAALASSETVAGSEVAGPSADAVEARTLRVVLAINAAMFVVEAVVGWLAESAGLLADSLDMLADATVYALGLYAVGQHAATKLRAAHVSGALQAALALGVLVDVIRRLVSGSAPEPPAMISVSAVALTANVACLLLLSRHRHGGTHMRASWIFSTNDVIANLGVMIAGGLVAWTGSHVPDLAIGAGVALLVLTGAVRILRLR